MYLTTGLIQICKLSNRQNPDNITCFPTQKSCMLMTEALFQMMLHNRKNTGHKLDNLSCYRTPRHERRAETPSGSAALGQ